MGAELRVDAKFQGGTKVFHTGGCDTGEGNCNSDDECKQPRRKCGIPGQDIEEFMFPDTRVCQEVRGRCDDWTAGETVILMKKVAFRSKVKVYKI